MCPDASDRRFRASPWVERNTLFYPELRCFEDDKERRAAWRTAFRYVWSRPLVWACIPLLIVVFIGVKQMLVELGAAPMIAGGICAGLFGFFVPVSAARFYRREIRRRLREQLLAVGIQVCVKCGYDLRGLIAGRCSECGTPYTDEIKSGE